MIDAGSRIGDPLCSTTLSTALRLMLAISQKTLSRREVARLLQLYYSGPAFPPIVNKEEQFWL